MEEGFPEIATAYKMIAKVETEHERRYLKLLQNVSEDKVFMKEGKSMVEMSELRLCI